MTTTPEGVREVPETDYSFVTEIRVQLARIEETLKPLSALAASLDNVRDTAREALRLAQQANQKIEQLEPAKDTADEALRNANAALKTLSSQADDQKWFRRTFYGSVITAVAGAVATAVWAAIKLGGV
ncbi:hypothetical protein [Paenibacillus sp. FSL K6-1230]|uniref:hypothetical protein n=1 Tax=Paenibacillus sp. FSL K6-1230 TaxID=2921603 RepID=UPI0030F52BAA